MTPPSRTSILTAAARAFGPREPDASVRDPKNSVVDKRADIWAFGVVLYEMLTGKRSFEGETPDFHGQPAVNLPP